MFIGKIIGAFIGLLTWGFPGLILGILVGHLFDKGRAGVAERFNPERKAAIEKAFFNAIFPLLGHLAKADGRISEEEIASTEHLISHMGLSSDARQEAIKLFKTGAQANFDIKPVVTEFIRVCGNYRDLKQIFLVYMITIAYADGTLHSEEERLLQEVADSLGYNRFAFNHLMGMVKAQSYFYRGQQEQTGYHYYERQYGGSTSRDRTRKNDLTLAYEALGVNEGDSDATIKKAYRRLMSEYHPDKLTGKGVPEDMVALATERSQEIQAAYELVKKSRQ